MAGTGRGRGRQSSTARTCARWLVGAALFAAACGGGAAGGKSGLGGSGAGAGSGGSSAATCPDVFAPTLQTFSIDIAAGDWAAIQDEFHTVGQLDGDTFVQHLPMLYPVTFHYGSETVTDAFIHL